VPLASELLMQELQLAAGSPGGMEAFRCSLTAGFFFKFYLTVRLKLQERWVSSKITNFRFVAVSIFEKKQKQPN